MALPDLDFDSFDRTRDSVGCNIGTDVRDLDTSFRDTGNGNRELTFDFAIRV